MTSNYYRFWLLMMGALCISMVHEMFAFILGGAIVMLGLVLPIFSGKIMAVGSKIEDTVSEKVAKKEAQEVVAEEEVEGAEEAPAEEKPTA